MDVGFGSRPDLAFLRAANERARHYLRSDLQSVVAILAGFGCSRWRLQPEGWNIIALQRKRSSQFHLRWGATFIQHPTSAFDVLFNDSLVVVARRGHPLAQARNVSKIEWDEYEWTLPGEDSPARTAFQRTFHERTGSVSRCSIETNSFVTMLTLLSRTDLLGVAPYQIFRVAWLQQEFVSLDVGFKFPSQPTGVIRRARSPLSPAAQFVIKELRHAARQLQAGKGGL